MSPNNSIAVIGFDLDDTLWSIDPTIQKANAKTWEFLCEQAPELKTISLKESLTSITPNIPKKYQHQITQARIYLMSEQLLSVGVPARKAEAIADQAMKVFLNYRHQLTFFDGAIECLQVLSRDYQLASISNGNANVSRIPEISDLFDFSINAENINSSKPEPDMFFKTLEHFKCKASQMVYVGDSIEHDIIPTQKLGIPSIWMNWNNKKQTSKIPTNEAHDFEDLLDILTSLNSDTIDT